MPSPVAEQFRQVIWTYSSDQSGVSYHLFQEGSPPPTPEKWLPHRRPRTHNRPPVDGDCPLYRRSSGRNWDRGWHHRHYRQWHHLPWPRRRLIHRRHRRQTKEGLPLRRYSKPESGSNITGSANTTGGETRTTQADAGVITQGSRSRNRDHLGWTPTFPMRHH